MKKVFFIIAFCFGIITTNTLILNAHELDKIVNVSDYLNKDYRKYANTTIYGKSYKKNIFGTKDRQVLEFGKIELDCLELCTISDNYFIGDNKSLTINNGTNYSLTQEVTSSKKTTIGVKNAVSAGVNLEDIELNDKIELTNEYEIYTSKRYSDNLTQSIEVITAKDLDNLCDNKTTYRVFKISINLKFNIKHSYIEEDFWGKWWEQSDSKNLKNYEVSYHLFDIVTFVYNDNTFGNKIVGNYKLSTIKEF